MSKHVGVLMRFECSHWVWGECVWVGVGMKRGVGGWVSEFWTSGIVYMLILTINMSTVCLTQFG